MDVTLSHRRLWLGLGRCAFNVKVKLRLILFQWCCRFIIYLFRAQWPCASWARNSSAGSKHSKLVPSVSSYVLQVNFQKKNKKKGESLIGRIILSPFRNRFQVQLLPWQVIRAKQVLKSSSDFLDDLREDPGMQGASHEKLTEVKGASYRFVLKIKRQVGVVKSVDSILAQAKSMLFKRREASKIN